MANPFAGTWTYRSFVNNPALTNGDPQKLQALLFGEGVLTVQDTPDTMFDATLSFGPDAVMDLKGSVVPAQGNAPARLHVVGRGRPGNSTEHYFYDYDGALTEHWPNGVNQVAATDQVGHPRQAT